MLYLVERFQNSNHMGSPKGPHFAVASPNTATDQNHGIDRLGVCPDYRDGQAKTRLAGRDLALSRPLPVR
jgi:hypothetical protein